MNQHEYTPLPAWDRRLTIFLRSESAPWPLQWCLGSDRSRCVRCGTESSPPACKKCKPHVDEILTAHPSNDWTKRYRKSVVKAKDPMKVVTTDPRYPRARAR